MIGGAIRRLVIRMTGTAVITNCTSKKRFAPDSRLRARTLPPCSVDGLSREWTSRRMEANAVPARDLYAGRSFSLAKRAAHHCRASLFAVSAGYGLISADDEIPSYSVTVSGDSEDNVLTIAGGAKSSSWWKALPPMRLSIADMADMDLIMVALPAEYLAMIEEDLEELRRSMCGTLLIFACPGAARRLSDGLAKHVMPYGDALEGSESPVRGTGTDAAQRRLLHFATHLAPANMVRTSLEMARRSVAAFAEATAHRERKVGRPASDDEIIAIIGQIRSIKIKSWTAALRHVRSERGIACSQSRFQALFQSAP